MSSGMTIFDMLGQSGVLTLLGMGVVFGFLVIMIITITLVGKAIKGLKLDKDLYAKAAAPAAATASSGGDKAAVTAAITAAVNEYRK
jgi:oxaloacetate decarboxylase gamma subunit